MQRSLLQREQPTGVFGVPPAQDGGAGQHITVSSCGVWLSEPHSVIGHADQAAPSVALLLQT